MKRGIGGELLVFMKMKMKMGRGVILGKDRVMGCLNLWDRGLKIPEILLGSWKLELVCPSYFEAGERVADG
jgi:hypothetical protein